MIAGHLDDGFPQSCRVVAEVEVNKFDDKRYRVVELTNQTTDIVTRLPEARKSYTEVSEVSKAAVRVFELYSLMVAGRL